MFHEVRVPLNAVTVGLTVLERDADAAHKKFLRQDRATLLNGPPTADQWRQHMHDSLVYREQQQETLAIMREQADAAVHILSSTLSLEKIAQGMLELDCMPVSVPDLVRSAVFSFRDVSASKGIELSFEIERGVPEVVVLDKTRINQCLGECVCVCARARSGATSVLRCFNPCA